jgi:hypothetical protein
MIDHGNYETAYRLDLSSSISNLQRYEVTTSRQLSNRVRALSLFDLTLIVPRFNLEHVQMVLRIGSKSS